MGAFYTVRQYVIYIYSCFSYFSLREILFLLFKKSFPQMCHMYIFTKAFLWRKSKFWNMHNAQCTCDNRRKKTIKQRNNSLLVQMKQCIVCLLLLLLGRYWTKKQQSVGADETIYCLFIATVIRKILKKFWHQYRCRKMCKEMCPVLVVVRMDSFPQLLRYKTDNPIAP